MNAPNLLHDDQPNKARRARVTAIVGNVMWELIQPLDELDILVRFLAETGEGGHHIVLATPNFDGMVAERT